MPAIHCCYRPASFVSHHDFALILSLSLFMSGDFALPFINIYIVSRLDRRAGGWIRCTREREQTTTIRLTNNKNSNSVLQRGVIETNNGILQHTIYEHSGEPFPFTSHHHHHHQAEACCTAQSRGFVTAVPVAVHSSDAPIQFSIFMQFKHIYSNFTTILARFTRNCP